MNLLLEIENVIEDNGSDFELSKLFKQYIKEYKESLPELFKSSQGKDFLVKHTKKLDSIVALMYKTILRRTFGDYLPMRNSIPIAIVALGSYGREQLCVHSDIDLLIVHEEVEGYQTQLIIEKLFYLALDAGLKLGHRVHPVHDLFKASLEDMTIKTALMETRFIIGSTFTWNSAERELTKIRLYEQKEFILDKIEEARIRHKKHALSMEPNVKEGIGGLRDSNLLFWIAHTIHGIKSLRELSGSLFTEEGYKEYRIALELLYRVRSALHLISNRQEDRLLLEYVPEVSNMLGFKEQQKMVSKVLESLWRINNFTKIFVKKMVRPYIADMSYVSQFRHNRISKGIYELNNRLYASYNLNTLSINDLLRILVSRGDKVFQYDAGFLSQFTYTTISHPLQKETYTLLKQLLSKEHVYSYLKLFYDAGVLHHLFANFRKVMHLPQFDGYHHYPVDVHSIKCIEALENIKEPFIKELYQTFNEEERLVLKTTTLFHDTGKGRKQDHSEVGVRLIAPFLTRLGLTKTLIERSSILVRNHILMSNVAFKENIHNEKTLYRFMSKIVDTKNLNLLYVLTYADINGVGGDTFNSFNSKLLYDLYTNALEVSENSERITDAKKRLIVEKRIKRNEVFKTFSRLQQKKILTIESNLFFFKHSANEIIEIYKIAKEIKEYNFTIKNKKNLTIEIYRKVPINIGFLLSSLANLNVANMEIFTLFDGVKYFRIDFIKNVEGNELVEVQDIIDNSFDMSRKVQIYDLDIQQDEVKLNCEHSKTHAEISVHTKNQKGLLSYLMNAFEELNINIITAKIHSSKYKVKDSFLIEKQNKLCDNSKEIFELLTKEK